MTGIIVIGDGDDGDVGNRASEPVSQLVCVETTSSAHNVVELEMVSMASLQSLEAVDAGAVAHALADVGNRPEQW